MEEMKRARAFFWSVFPGFRRKQEINGMVIKLEILCVVNQAMTIVVI